MRSIFDPEPADMNTDKSTGRETSSANKSRSRRSWIEIGAIVTVGAILYLTGLHTEVIGTLQRGLLATGLIQPSYSYTVDAGEMSEAGTEFYFAGADGATRNLAAYRGKVIFLNVWASWCAPCVAEMPSIESLYADLKNDEEVEFLLISVDEDFDDAKDFVESREMDLPIYHYRGKDPDIFDSDVVPTTYVITPSGKMAMEKKGMAKYDTDNFKAYLEKLKDM